MKSGRYIVIAAVLACLTFPAFSQTSGYSPNLGSGYPSARYYSTYPSYYYTGVYDYDPYSYSYATPSYARAHASPYYHANANQLRSYVRRPTFSLGYSSSGMYGTYYW